MNFELEEKTKRTMEHIKQELSEHTPVFPDVVMPETSSVLIPLIVKDGKIGILYEQRACGLGSQPGEICFPGGRHEGKESREATAVRETCEELHVQKNQIEVIGGMDGVMGPSGAPVWPFPAILNGYEGTWSEDEVDHTFTVPLDWFLTHAPAIYETKMVTVPDDDFPYELIPGGRHYKWREKKHAVYFYRTDEAVIWGLTARITASFVKLWKHQ